MNGRCDSCFKYPCPTSIVMGSNYSCSAWEPANPFGDLNHVEEKNSDPAEKISLTASYELDETMVKNILAEYFRGKGYDLTAHDITINVGTECRGYGMGEHMVTVFKNITVKMKTTI